MRIIVEERSSEGVNNLKQGDVFIANGIEEHPYLVIEGHRVVNIVNGHLLCVGDFRGVSDVIQIARNVTLRLEM
jgi:hypothetical protein